MEDVARIANVSAMTVSRALRDPEVVSEETRERISDAMRTLNYVPNKVAGSLKSQTSNLVAAIVPSLQNSLFSETLQGLSDGLREVNLNLVAGSSGYSSSSNERLIREFLSLRPRGLVLHEAVQDLSVCSLLREAGVPVVVVGDLTKESIDMVVSFSNRAAAFEMTRHLIECGRKRIGVITLPVTASRRSRARLAGYKQALKQACIAFDGKLVFETTGGLSNGGRGLVDLMAREPLLDAVFGLGDVFAAGALLACQRKRIPVPGRIAIASFDDSPLLSELRPALTTLKIPRYEIGRRAAGLIVQRVYGTKPPATILDLGFTVVRREST